MPDQPELTPDPFPERLGRFTPHVGLDRAQILFQAGRASVHGRRFWPALAVVLAVSQTSTLALVIWGAPQAASPVPNAMTSTSGPTALDAEPLAPSPDPDADLVRVRQPGGSLELPPERPVEHLVSSGPPLDMLTLRGGLRSAGDSNPGPTD
jgi:hypothetical protein